MTAAVTYPDHVDGAVDLVGGLLSGLHGVFGLWGVLGRCPGDWTVTTIVAGGVFAVIPVLTAMMVAVIRKVTGSRYNVGMVSVFFLLGFVGNLALPSWLFASVSRLFGDAANREPAPGFGVNDLIGLNRPVCIVLPSQNELLGRSPSVHLAISDYLGPPARWIAIAALVVVPVFVLFWITRQAKQAFRGGARWPARLYYLPFCGTIALTAPLHAGVAGLLWLGFLPVSATGVLAVKVLGTPSDAVLRPAVSPVESQHYPGSSAPPVHSGQPGPSGPPAPPVPSYQPPPRALPPVTRVYGEPTVVDSAVPAAPPRGLANTPGPLPWAQNPPASTPASLDATTRTDTTGDRIGGRFHRIRQLGSGGFGKVWLAMDASLGRQVAIKIAHANDAETEQRMYREARALAAVRHPNCVRVYDILDDPDGIAIVMEYVEGPSLANALDDGGPLDDIAAARLWCTMAGALAAAHEKSVMHRDIKPSNVIIDRSGVAHLIDFGLARRHGDNTLTATGMMVGTPDFLAPEVAKGEPATPASDAWQLAATVSFALTGHPPRGHRSNPMAALVAAATGEACVRLPDRSVHRRLLMAALDSDPNHRPTLGRIQQQLEVWLSSAGLSQDGPVTTVVRKR